MKHKVGERVGAFCSGYVYFGKILEKETKCKKVDNKIVNTENYYLISDGKNDYKTWWHEKLVFPVWKGKAFSQKDFTRLSYALHSIRSSGLAYAISEGFEDYSGEVMFEICAKLREMLIFGIFNAEPQAEKVVEEFLDWANHGFQVPKEQKPVWKQAQGMRRGYWDVE